jgi:para-aminobenzoate synthetase/4-amino-4-deoxychorismate lyase
MMWHLTVKAGTRLAPGVRLVDTFRALFPALSVTGVPKPPAMRLIATIEDTPRGAYCGAAGFLAPSGYSGPDASFSVAVRTVVVDHEEGVAEFGVGTPITGAPDVVSAYEEARLKARVLVDRRSDFKVFERFRIENGIVRAIETKVAALVASARYFGFDVETSAIAGALRGLNGIPNPAVLTLSVDRAGGVESDIEEAPTWSETPDSAAEVTGVVAEQSVLSDNVFLFHHTTDGRLREAVNRAYGDFDAVLFFNDHEELAGSLDANVAVRIADGWITPPRGCGNPKSAFPARLIETGVIREAVITRERFEVADQVALLDDVFGWRIVSLAG